MKLKIRDQKEASKHLFKFLSMTPDERAEYFKKDFKEKGKALQSILKRTLKRRGKHYKMK